jgi:hypothetical protein
MNAHALQSSLSRPRRIALWTLGVLTVLLVLLILVALLMPWNWLREPIEQQVQETSGREATIDGNLGLRLGWPPWHPVIVADGVRLGNAAWSAEPYMMVADQVEARVRLLDALRGNWNFPVVTLHRARLLFEWNEHGVSNWDGVFDDEGRDEGGTDIGRLVVREGEVVLRDPMRQLHARILIDSATDAVAAGRPVPMDITGQGRYRGQPFELNGRIDSPLVMGQPGQGFAIDLQAGSGATRVHATGELDAADPFEAFDLQVSLAGDDLRELQPLFDIDAPPSPPYEIRGRLRRDGVAWQFSDMQGSLAQLAWRGDAAFALGEAQPFELSLIDVEAAFENPAQQAQVRMQVRQAAPDAPLTIAGQGSYRGQPVEISGNVQPPDPLGAPGQRYRLELQAASGSTRARARGELSAERPLEGFDIEWSLAGEDGGELDGWVAAELPATSPYRIEGSLRRDGPDWQLADMQGQLGESEWRGDVAFRVGDGLQPLSVVTVDAEANLRDPDQETELRLQVNQQAADDALQIAGEGNYRGQPFKLHGKVDPPMPLGEPEQDYRLDLQASAGSTRARMHGRLSGTQPLQAFDIALELAGDDLAALDGLTAIDLPTTAPYEVQARLLREDSRWQLTDVQGEMGEHQWQGALAFRLGPDQPFAMIAVDAQARIRDSAAGTDLSLHAQSTDLPEQPGRALVPLQLSGEGSYRGQPFDLAGRVAPPDQPGDADGDWALNLQLHAGESRAHARGSLSSAQPLQAFDVRVELAGGDLAELDAFIPAEMPATSPYEISAHLRRDAGRL